MHHAYSPDLIERYFLRGTTEIPYSKARVRPAMYLAFAQADFKGKKDARTLVNTISNARRALHYQVESLTNALGWAHSKRSENFRARLRFLNLCGVLSPTIVGRINRTSGTVEDDYYLPTEEETFEFLDLVEFCFGSVYQTATHFPDAVDAELMVDADDYESAPAYPERIRVHLPLGEGRLKITFEGRAIVDTSVTDPLYFDWVSAIIRQNEV